MSRKCLTCDHPQIKEIEALLLNNSQYLAISRNFKVSRDSVRNHAKNHLKPLIDAANKQAQQSVVDEIEQMRKEVNYPALVKVKLLQEKILDDLDGAEKLERPPLYREFRGALQEEAKLGGLYQKEKENDDALTAVKRAIQLKADEKGITYEQELNNYLDHYALPEVKDKLISELEQ